MRIPDAVRLNMRSDRESGMTLTQLMGKYGRSRSTVSYAVRGCDTSMVMKAAPGKRIVPSVESKERPGLSTTDLGEAARQMICARMMIEGIKVFRPMTEDTPVDLLVLRKDGSIAKCQCKYLFPSVRGCHMLKCSSSGRGEERGTGRHIYTEKEIDFFLGYCWDNDDVYVVPRSFTAGRQECALWILRGPLGRGNRESVDGEKFRRAFAGLK